MRILPYGRFGDHFQIGRIDDCKRVITLGENQQGFRRRCNDARGKNDSEKREDCGFHKSSSRCM